MDAAGVAGVACALAFELLSRGLRAALDAFHAARARLFPDEQRAAPGVGPREGASCPISTGVGPREGASWAEEELWVFMLTLLLHQQVPPPTVPPTVFKATRDRALVGTVGDA